MLSPLILSAVLFETESVQESIRQLACQIVVCPHHLQVNLTSTVNNVPSILEKIGCPKKSVEKNLKFKLGGSRKKKNKRTSSSDICS
jgi:hypothetical protein